MNRFLGSPAPADPSGGNHDPGDFAALLQARGLYPRAALPAAGSPAKGSKKPLLLKAPILIAWELPA